MADPSDDLFGDLLGGTTRTSPGSAASQTGSGAGLKSGPMIKQQQGLSGPRKSRDGPPPGKQISEMFNSNGSGAAEEPASAETATTMQTPTPPSITKEELHAVVSGAVQAALDATMGKFVKSLRTVLEDLGKRVDGNVHSIADLRSDLGQITEALESQSQNFHSRFTSIDVSLKEIDRGVQALRDKQELHEAQAMLAKFAHQDVPAAQQPASEARPTTPASTSSAAAVAAPASAVAAPAPAAAPSPQPTQPVPQPQVTPTPVYAHQPMQAQPQQHPHQHPQQQAQQHIQQQAPQPAMHAATAPQPVPVQHEMSAPHQYNTNMQPGAPQPYQYSQATAPTQALHPTSEPYNPPAASQPSHSYIQSMPSGGSNMSYGPQHTGQSQTQLTAPPGPMPAPHTQPTPLQQQTSLPGQQGMMPGPAPHMQGMGMHMGPHSMPPASQVPPLPAGPNYPAPNLSYPAPPQPSAYPMPMYGANRPGPGAPPAFQSMGSMTGGPPPQSRTNTKSIRLDDIIADITAMGFERHQVMAVIQSMQKAGQAVDLNQVIDRLTNGRY